jgi:hypothetical protein
MTIPQFTVFIARRIAGIDAVVATEHPDYGCRLMRVSDQVHFPGVMPSLDAVCQTWKMFEQRVGREEALAWVESDRPSVDLLTEWWAAIESKPWGREIDIFDWSGID